MGKRKLDFARAAEFILFDGGIILMLLAVQILMIVYFNLSDIRNSLDTDFANTIYHFREAAKNGTLDLKGWEHTTSMEIDAVFLFALPIYCLIHNIFIAAGLSNLIYVLLYIVTIYGIMKHINIDKKYIFVTLCLVLTPYSFGMLEYFNMMFYGGSCYSLKTLVPLLCIWLLMLFEKQSAARREKFAKASVLCVYLFFLFITAFSTGIYVMLCGIFPICFCMFFDVWKSGKAFGRYNRRQIGVLIGSFIVYAFGYLLHEKFFGLVSRTNMRLTRIENYAINFRACVRGIFDVFGTTVSEDIQALSVKGIWYCAKMAIIVMFLLVWIYNLKLLFKKCEKISVKGFLAILPLFNFLILLIADSRFTTNPHIEYRYYLIGAVPMVILFGMQLHEWSKGLNDFQNKIAVIAMFMILVIVMAGNNKDVMDKWDRTSYAVDLCDYFNTLDIESVFFVDDPDTSQICRGIDENHKYGTFMSDTQTLYLGICSYLESKHGSFYGNKNAMAVFIYTVPEDYMPAEIAGHYKKVGNVRWFDIYVADQVWFP